MTGNAPSTQEVISIIGVHPAYFARMVIFYGPFCLQHCSFLLATYFAQNYGSKLCQGLLIAMYPDPFRSVESIDDKHRSDCHFLTLILVFRHLFLAASPIFDLLIAAPLLVSVSSYL